MPYLHWQKSGGKRLEQTKGQGLLDGSLMNETTPLRQN